MSCFTRCVVWGSGEIELCAQDDEITARQSAAHKPNSFMADSATSTAFTLANIKLSLTVNWIRPWALENNAPIINGYRFFYKYKVLHSRKNHLVLLLPKQMMFYFCSLHVWVRKGQIQYGWISSEGICAAHPCTSNLLWPQGPCMH